MATIQEIQSYLQANPTMTDAQIAAAMQQYSVTPEQMAQATNIPLADVQSRYNAVVNTTPVASSNLLQQITPNQAQNVLQTTTSNPLNQLLSINPMATDQQIAAWMQSQGYSPTQISQWSGIPEADVQSRYFQATLPSALGTSTGTSRIDPAIMPYLQMGLQRAQQLFLTGQQPSLYPGQMYVSPSQQTLSALSQQEQLAGNTAGLQRAQEAYQASLGQLGQTAGGAFLQGSPYREQMIQSAIRPLQQKFESETLPGIASGFSKAGRYGSGAMGRAQSQATEAFGRSMGDVASNIAYTDYANERARQQQAQVQQAALAQAAPSFFQMGLLPSQTLAQVGAAREAIAAQPLQEAMQRYQYQQQLPYSQLQGYLSSVYGNPMTQSNYMPTGTQTNQLGQAIGLGTLGYLGGSALANTAWGQSSGFGSYMPLIGAAGGGLLGYGL